MNIKKIGAIVAVMALFGSLSLSLPAFADTVNANIGANVSADVGVGAGHGPMGGRRMGMRPGVAGTVASVSGNTITVTGRQGMGPNNNSSSVTYTVDATNATVMKNNATSSLSSVAVGDMVFVQGTVSGTNVTATMIRDGVFPKGGPGMRGQDGPNASGTAQVIGNGQPVVAGKVSAISGNTLTISNASNVTYTVDTTNAKVLQGQNTVALSSVAVGDNVIVQGTINGNAITATTVIDHSATANATAGQNGKPRGFMAGIGQFFMHIFGF